MPLPIVHLDKETRSTCDLAKCGSARYANDPTTRILMIGVARGKREPVLWAPGQYRDIFASTDFQEADDIIASLNEPEQLIYAHSSAFEIFLADARFHKDVGYPAPNHKQWRCTAAMARRAALPAKLSKVAEALRLPQQKDTKGMALIRKFSCPQKPRARSKKAFKEWILPHDEPEEFRLFGEYCLQDVRVESMVQEALAPFELSGFALETFQLDIAINTRGMPVNVDGLHKAQNIIVEEIGVQAELFREITGLNPTQNVKYLAWLKARGYTAENLQADTLEEQLEDLEFDPDTEVGKSLLILQRLSFAAVKKIPAMIRCAGPHDNKVRGTLTYHGAGPGRWSASLIQPHNMKRPDASLIDGMDWAAMGYESSDDALGAFTAMAYRDICKGRSRDYINLVYGSPLSVLSSCIRHFIHDVRPDGSERPMVNSDYSAIEARLLAWLAGEEWRLKVFRTHGKIYEASACQMFGLSMEQITKPIRQKGKVAELALGYKGSVGALVAMGALKMGLTEEELPAIVKAWRKANPMIRAYWAACNKAAMAAVNAPGTSFLVGKVSYHCEQAAGMRYLFCKLPSGRLIAYPQPRVERQLGYNYKGKQVWVVNPGDEEIARAVRRVGEEGYYITKCVTAFGELTKHTVGRFTIPPGAFVENQCQGIAADIMAVGLINLEANDYRVLNTIHDEALSYRDYDWQSAEEMSALMVDQPAWADGLPLKAEGGIINFYSK